MGLRPAAGSKFRADGQWASRLYNFYNVRDAMRSRWMARASASRAAGSPCRPRGGARDRARRRRDRLHAGVSFHATTDEVRDTAVTDQQAHGTYAKLLEALRALTPRPAITEADHPIEYVIAEGRETTVTRMPAALFRLIGGNPGQDSTLIPVQRMSPGPGAGPRASAGTWDRTPLLISFYKCRYASPIRHAAGRGHQLAASRAA